jgi:hypothetical protein
VPLRGSEGRDSFKVNDGQGSHYPTELWSYVGLWQKLDQSACCRVLTLSFVGATSGNVVQVFFPSSFDSFACDWVRNTATYGLLWSILSSLAHSVTIEALWWYVAVPKRLQLWLGAMHTHFHLTRPRTRSTAEASRRRITGDVRVESTTYACAQLMVYQDKIQASTNGE